MLGNRRSIAEGSTSNRKRLPDVEDEIEHGDVKRQHVGTGRGVGELGN
jgi:hypothetical protein